MNKDNYVPMEQLRKFKEYYDKQEGRKYPCSNQIVKCGIITKDRNLAMDFMKNKNVVKKWERKDEIMWELDNGEQWLWKNWTGNCRGYRFYKVAIDKMIDKDLFNYFVRPYCSLYCCSVEII